MQLRSYIPDEKIALFTVDVKKILNEESDEKIKSNQATALINLSQELLRDFLSLTFSLKKFNKRPFIEIIQESQAIHDRFLENSRRLFPSLAAQHEVAKKIYTVSVFFSARCLFKDKINSIYEEEIEALDLKKFADCDIEKFKTDVREICEEEKVAPETQEKCIDAYLEHYHVILTMLNKAQYNIEQNIMLKKSFMKLQENFEKNLFALFASKEVAVQVAHKIARLPLSLLKKSFVELKGAEMDAKGFSYMKSEIMGLLNLTNKLFSSPASEKNNWLMDSLANSGLFSTTTDNITEKKSSITLKK